MFTNACATVELWHTSHFTSLRKTSNIGGRFNAQKPKNMHTQIHLEVFHPSQTALASWQCGKHHLEKNSLISLHFLPLVMKIPKNFSPITHRNNSSLSRRGKMR